MIYHPTDLLSKIVTGYLRSRIIKYHQKQNNIQFGEHNIATNEKKSVLSLVA